VQRAVVAAVGRPLAWSTNQRRFVSYHRNVVACDRAGARPSAIHRACHAPAPTAVHRAGFLAEGGLRVDARGFFVHHPVPVPVAPVVVAAGRGVALREAVEEVRVAVVVFFAVFLQSPRRALGQVPAARFR